MSVYCGVFRMLPLRPGAVQAGPDTALRARSLSKCAEDMHLQLPRWRGRVNALIKRDKCDAESLELLEQND